MQRVTFMTYLVAIQKRAVVCVCVRQVRPSTKMSRVDSKSGRLQAPPSDFAPNGPPREAIGSVCAVHTLPLTVPTNEIDLFIILKWKSIKDI